MLGELEALAIKGGAKPGDLQRKLDDCHSIIWPVDGGCFVLDCATDDALVVWLAIGKGALKALMEAEQEIAAFARRNGCTRLRIEGRKGWKRLLPHWTCVENNEMVTLELPI